MKMKVIAIFDHATKSFSVPEATPHIGAAMRSFTDHANNKENAIGRHPDDYELFELGEFDTNTGLFATGAPVSVCRAKNVVRG